MSVAAAVEPMKYRTLRRLAVGGMGEIFLAREQGVLSRLVVIKKMLPQVAQAPENVAMFIDEARIVGQLAHPNICQILELGVERDGLPFIVLEYVRGESAAALWDRSYAQRETMPLAVTLRILADTARALHYAHEATDADGRALNIVHRDVTPHNIMITYDGDVKLMDFGVARADNREHRTETGQIKGKIAYMSPEQLRAQPLDRRADVFAIGVMLWELTLGRRLFRGADQLETLRNAAACVVPLPRSIDEDYPEELEAIVMRAVAADREDRTASAGELAAELLDQVAALGGAERADVAAVVRRVFPKAAVAQVEEEPTDVDPDVREIQTVSLSLVEEPRGHATTPLRSPAALELHGQATAPLAPRVQAEPRAVDVGAGRGAGTVGAADPGSVGAGSVGAREVPPERSSSRRAMVAALFGVVVAGGVIAAIVTRGGPDEPAAKVAVAAPPPIDAAAAIEPRAPVDASAVDPEIADPAPPPEAPSLAPTHAHAGTAHAASASPPPHAAATTTVEPAPPPDAAATGPGLLAVASDQTAVVVIDGVRRKSTPFQTELSAGHHDVALELAEGGGTLRAPADIAVGRKTKCIAKAGVLTCTAQD